MPLHGKVALIPGASRPIGRAIARKFASHGATLVLPVYDWPESIAEMEDEFQTAHFDYLSITVDLQQEEAVMLLAESIKTRFGSVDFLINNIERGGMPAVHGSYDLPHNKTQWDLELNTTMKAKWLLYHYLYPIMGNHVGGAVVNISSVAAITGRSGPAAGFFSDGYSAANRAIQSFTETWAREAAPSIRVNELMLGLIQHRHGESTRGWDSLTYQETKDLRETILLERTGLPEEVAAAVYFLAVDASYITGAILRMDGGFILGGNKVPPIPPGILP
ncbi:MAG: SDR family oxidoreductase [Proteobacteria bacterium]|nr:SDR family oxidoreductase [Pseudomonadota bacterium]